MSPSDQAKFFDKIVLRNNTLHRYIEIDGNELTLKISNTVVNTTIGELLFRPEDEMVALKHDDGEVLDPNIAESVARLIKLKRNALLLFKPDTEADDESYVVVIKTSSGSSSSSSTHRATCRFGRSRSQSDTRVT